MSYFDVFGSIFEKSAMTDLPNIIVSMYNFCMIPQVWTLTFGLNLSWAWGDTDILMPAADWSPQMTGGWIWVTCRGPNTLPESDVGAVHAKYAGWFKYLFLHTRRNSKCHCMMAAELGHGRRRGALQRKEQVMQPHSGQCRHGMETRRGHKQICPQQWHC